MRWKLRGLLVLAAVAIILSYWRVGGSIDWSAGDLIRGWAGEANLVNCGSNCELPSTGWRSMPGFMAVLLSLAPLMVLVASEAGQRRSRRLFDNMPEPVQKTMFYKRAGLSIARRTFVPWRVAVAESGAQESAAQVVHRGLLFWFALLLVTLVMFLSWNFVMNAPLGRAGYVDPMVPFLRGLNWPLGDHGAAARQFASQTLTINGVAFTVAYVVVLFRMFVRLNTATMNAIETLFDVMHLMATIMVATVGRVVLASFEVDEKFSMAFAVVAGIRPTLALDLLWSWARRSVQGIIASMPPERRAPQDAEIPIEIPIEMLDGIGDRRREVAERLEGLDITTCQRLAFHNPLLIWERSPYHLPEIMDWCGQAMLAVVLPSRLVALRECGVRTIHDLLGFLDAEYDPVLRALGIGAVEAATLAAGIRTCAQVRQLEELRRVL